ncbi:MAG: dihydropteroate synthase [Candidatus Margulisiibacteriota bacterium]|jgi:dihydropteroate synthase
MLQPLTIGNTNFDFKKPYIMGIINLTPDSFSDQGLYCNPKKALKKIETLINEGADIIDIGAESTRPNAIAISAEEEIQRLKPILDVYKKKFTIPLSLDTTKSKVAHFGLDLGVDLINDISGLKFDPQIATLVKQYGVPIILMHTKGNPQNMQLNPQYNSVIQEVIEELLKSIKIAKAVGVKKIIIDPGIGFGKTIEHNLTILNQLDKFLVLGYPLLIGTSRKSFLGQITGSPVNNRIYETLSSVIFTYLKGANFFRVHDVAPTKKALEVAFRIRQSNDV